MWAAGTDPLSQRAFGCSTERAFFDCKTTRFQEISKIGDFNSSANVDIRISGPLLRVQVTKIRTTLFEVPRNQDVQLLPW